MLGFAENQTLPVSSVSWKKKKEKYQTVSISLYSVMLKCYVPIAGSLQSFAQLLMSLGCVFSEVDYSSKMDKLTKGKFKEIQFSTLLLPV